MPLPTRFVASLVALSLTTACSHSATVMLEDGSRVDGEILGGTPASVLVQDDAAEEGAPPVAIRRDDVYRIVHPGTLATILGSLTMAAGLTVMTVGIAGEAGCSGEFCGYHHLFLTIPGAGVAGLSLIPTIWGISAWAGSGSRASSEEGLTTSSHGVVLHF